MADVESGVFAGHRPGKHLKLSTNGIFEGKVSQKCLFMSFYKAKTLLLRQNVPLCEGQMPLCEHKLPLCEAQLPLYEVQRGFCLKS